ncbi:hypothetical protein [Shimia sp.]|uniref:hypothetical protein n=1 Tax=Shimia sp. TaxID=1954381 RepID=UPI0035681213
MNHQRTAVFAALVTLLPLAAQADAPAFYGGTAGSVTFDDQLSHSGNTFEAYIGAELNGFYAEAWMGSLSDPVDDFEFELSAGYGADLNDSLSYALWATGFYLNNSGYQNYELAAGLYYAASDSLELGTELAWDPATDDLNKAVLFSWGASDRITVEGELGHSDANSETYWELAALYDLGKGFGTGLLYEDTNTGAGQVSLILSWDIE